MREGLIEHFREQGEIRQERMRQRYQELEALHTEVSRFVAQSSLLVGADKIREVLKRLEGSNDLK